MHTSRFALFITLMVTAGLIAGCGGGGGSSSLTPRAPGGGPSGNFTVKIVIPKATQASTRRRPSYVPSTLQSVVVQILSGSTPLVSGNNFVNVTSSGSASGGSCSTTAGATTCTITVNAAITSAGTYNVIVATYDAPQSAACVPAATPACVGNALSVSTLPQTITPGSASSLAVTLGGIPAYFQPYELVSGYIGGDHVNGLAVFGPGPQVAQFKLLDADKNVIIGPGAPTITATNTAALHVAVSSASGAGVYTLTFTPQTIASAVGPVVQATTVPVQFTLAVPNTTFTSTFSFSVAVAHSAIYVARTATAADASCGNSSNPGLLTIDAFLDGNTTPSQTAYCTGASPYIGLAVDRQGDLWVADRGNNELVEFPPAAASGTWPEAAIVCGAGNAAANCNVLSSVMASPSSLVFDSSNNAFVTNFCCGASSIYQVTQFTAPAPTSSPNFTTASFTYPGSATLSFDRVTTDSPNNAPGQLYVGAFDQSNSTPKLLAFSSGSSSPVTLVNSLDVGGFGIEPLHGYLWVLVANTSVTPYTLTAHLLNPANVSIVATISSGLPTVNASNAGSGLAVDSTGNVFVVGTNTAGIAEFSAPSYTPSVLGSVTAPSNIVVVPDGNFGERNQLGVIATDTPTPIATPTP